MKLPSSPKCFDCMDTGMLSDMIYYNFCGLYGQRCCSCPEGNTAFKKWCQGKPVQTALKEKRQKEIRQALAFSGIPKRWREKTMEGIEGRENLKLRLNYYLDHFRQFQEQGIGIYLWSCGSGKGKTHILSAVCQQIIERYLIPCIFMTEEEIYRKIREAFDNPQLTEQTRFQKFSGIPCLFIDDFGATKATAWKTEVFTSLLNYRMEHCLPTFFTSNYSPADYQKFIANSLILSRPERISSRIYELCRGFIIEVKGEDFRKKLKPVLPQ